MIKSLYLLCLLLSACTLWEPSKNVNNNFVGTKYPHQNVYKNAVVAAQGEGTGRCAELLLKQGGNLVDAFVATSFCISVERPQSTGLGGGGFILYTPPNSSKVEAWDFRERAPLKSFKDMYLDSSGVVDKMRSRTGALASGTPGLVKGLYEFHKKYGKLKWSEVLAPSIKLAREGFAVYPHLAKAIDVSREHLLQDQHLKKLFFKDGSALAVGSMIYQPDLANTIERIAKNGADEFYHGKTAKLIASFHRQNGGLITLRDLRKYKVKLRSAVESTVFGHKIYSMPRPSSGGTHVIQILKLMELTMDQWRSDESLRYHYLAQAMQLSFYDRAKFMGDSDFYKFDTNKLIQLYYLKKQAKLMNSKRVMKASEVGDALTPISPDHTTHMSLMGKNGEVIVSTQTINGYFGAHQMVPETGIILNNEMDDFAAAKGASNLFGAIGGNYNLVEPLKTPLSSMSPTIVFKGDRPILGFGSPNGTRIITCVAQSIFNRIYLGLSLSDSVARVRIHQQWKPDELIIEPPGFNRALMQKLSDLGHEIKLKSTGCKVQAVESHSKFLEGVSDIRGEGAVVGI